MNRNLIKSKTITPISHKLFKKLNINILILSLNHTIDNSNDILLKDWKKNKNSYFEEHLDNRSLLIIKGEDHKIRRVKSNVNKKNIYLIRIILITKN